MFSRGPGCQFALFTMRCIAASSSDDSRNSRYRHVRLRHDERRKQRLSARSRAVSRLSSQARYPRQRAGSLARAELRALRSAASTGASQGLGSTAAGLGPCPSRAGDYPPLSKWPRARRPPAPCATRRRPTWPR
eukprot:22429-Pleurochrysis_carterae.AAC.2